MAADPVADPTVHRFTVKDYHRMAEAEVFGPDDRLELLDGEVLEKAPLDRRHAGYVNRLNHLFVSPLGERAVVAVQNPIEVDDYSGPQPDLVNVEALHVATPSGVRRLVRGSSVAPQAFPELLIEVTDIVGPVR